MNLYVSGTGLGMLYKSLDFIIAVLYWNSYTGVLCFLCYHTELIVDFFFFLFRVYSVSLLILYPYNPESCEKHYFAGKARP